MLVVVAIIASLIWRHGRISYHHLVRRNKVHIRFGAKHENEPVTTSFDELVGSPQYRRRCTRLCQSAAVATGRPSRLSFLSPACRSKPNASSIILLGLDFPVLLLAAAAATGLCGPIKLALRVGPLLHHVRKRALYLEKMGQCKCVCRVSVDDKPCITNNK